MLKVTDEEIIVCYLFSLGAACAGFARAGLESASSCALFDPTKESAEGL